MATSFQSRRIDLTFQLAAGSFNKAGEPDTVTFSGLRCKVEIDAPGGFEFSTARIRVYGIAQETMSRLTTINWQNLDFLRNTIRVDASGPDGQVSSIFLGTIYSSIPDYSAAPDVALVIEARAGLIGSLQPSNPYSYPGPQRVSQMCTDIARELGLALEDNGVTTVLTDMYLTGSPLQRLHTIADASKIQFWFLPDQGILAIAPPNIPRGNSIATVNAGTGLVGWPHPLHVGVAFTAVFDPVFQHGTQIKLETDISSCAGNWYIISMSHRLDAEAPGGAWFTHFIATPTRNAIRR